jgi:hypothetical protein
MKKTIATTTLLATALAGSTLAWAAPAQADDDGDDGRHNGPSRTGTCAGAVFELDVDRERRGYDVDADINGARAFSTWNVAIRHNGQVAVSRTLKADDEGELDLDAFRKNTRGKDTFKLTVTPAGGSSCSVRLTAA